MKYEGYVPKEKLPIKPGDTVTIRKGVMVTHRGQSKPAGRTFKVKVHHVISGRTMDDGDRAYEIRHGRSGKDINAAVRWPGSGGYWSEVDINDVPEAQK